MGFGNRVRAGVALGATALGLMASGGMAGSANAWVGGSYVRYGDSGPGAWCVQHGLDAMDRGDIWVVQDGQFGPATLAAVKKFQGIFGLAQDGVVGPATGQQLMDAMYRDYASNGADGDVSPWGWYSLQGCYGNLPTQH